MLSRRSDYNGSVFQAKLPDYGLDAPRVVLGLSIGAATALALALLSVMAGPRWFSPPVAKAVGLTFFFTGAALGGTAGLMIRGSRVGKVRLREKHLDALALRGNEQVLDVGCGHGLMLIGAAKRLTTGHAAGIDLWQAEDQAGNTAEATLANARAEGVADKLSVQTADARAMPFADASFNLVLSSYALHNIYDAPGRARAISEIIRVLKPGGRALITDIRHTEEYAGVFRACGCGVDMLGKNHLFLTPSQTLVATKSARP